MIAAPARHAGLRLATLGQNLAQENHQRTNPCEALKPSPFPAAQRLRSTNDFQPQAADQGEKKIEVDNASFKVSLGNRKLKAEKNLIAQALSNLLENAVKYADPESKIFVRGEKGAGFGVSVTSVGLPITEEDKKRIFQRGERGATAQKRVPAGTGIGLYLASRVMRLHDGTITLDTDGKTSCFTLAFPKSRIT